MASFSDKKTVKTDVTKTPTNPQWATDQVQQYGDKVNNFMGLDPQSLVAGPSALQEQAFAGVQNLGGWQAGNQTAQGMAQTAGNAGPSLYNGVKLGAADQVGDVNSESHSLLDGFQNYMNPALDSLVKASMASYDEDAGRQRAAMAANGARNDAFSGSRWGLAEGQFEADTGRNRAMTDAQLRSNAFDRAAQLSGQDAGRRQSSSEFNAGLDQNRLVTNANANNQFALSQAGFDSQQGMYNATAQEQALARQLQAAGLMGGLSDSAGANSRADLGLTADFGNIQQQIEQAKAYAPAQQLLIGGQAMGATPYSLFNGMNMTGTEFTKSKPSLMSMFLGASEKIGNAMAAGAGGGG